MVVALAVNLSETTAAERALLHGVLAGATVTVALLVGGPFTVALGAAVRRRRVSIEALFFCGIVGASGLSAWAMLRRQGDVYLEVVSLLLAIYALGQRLKISQQEALRLQLKRLGRAPPSCVFVDGPQGGGARRGSSKEVRAGTFLRLDPDTLAPVDGQVVAGEATFDLSSLTGEPMGVAKRRGAQLPAGARCLDGFVIVAAEGEVADSSMARLQATIAAALAQRSRIEARAELALAPFTAGVVGLALATAAFWGWRGGAALAFLNAMAVLLVACPCALGFATPVGMWTAVVRLARRGVVVRSTAAIERLARVDVVALDKTGTLTELTLAPHNLAMSADAAMGRDALVAMVQVAQASADHPIARAFDQLGQGRADAPRWAVAGAAGRAQAGVLSVQLAAGEARRTLSFTAHPCRSQAGDPQPTSATRQAPPLALRHIDATAHRHASSLAALLEACPPGAWPIAIAVDGQLAAVAALHESVTPAALRAIAQLQALGLRAVVLSGDTPERAAATGLGLTYGGLTPVGKQRAVGDLAAGCGGGVCMVGDGINDAAAMASAQVSMAVGEAAALAVETADFSLPRAGLDALGPAVQICRQTLRTVRHNLLISGCYNLVGMAAAAAGLLHPAWAALLMVAASMTVTWRSARLLEAPAS